MYKKIILTLSFFALSIIIAFSQNHIEALRYSQQFYSGSAKSEAMGNSLSAVGADFSSIITNPAGIAIYKSTQFAFTPNFIINKTQGTFSGNMTKEHAIGFNFSNAGYVAVYEFNGTVKSFNIGIAYNNTNDFRQRLDVNAKNQNQSFLDYIVYNAKSEQKRYSDFREDLAYETYLLESDDDGYYSWVTHKGKYGNSQRKTINTKGGSGEFSFSVGFNINDILYLGGTVGLNSINYTYESSLKEADYLELYKVTGTDSVQVNNDELEYTETLNTDGSGINAKFGFLFQPVKFLRFGGAIHSSTAYNIEEYYRASMKSKFPTIDDNGNDNYEFSAKNAFAYRLSTPLRANLGVAVILEAYEIGKFFTTPMILSADYEYVDYSKAYLRPEGSGNENFDDENKNTQSFYKETHNFRAGAEFNFGIVKIRTGASLYSNPYSNESMFKNAKLTYSGGLGFASKHSYVDLSYSYSPTMETLNLYNATDIYPNDPIGNIPEPKASIFNSKQFFKITLGLRM